VKAGQAQDPVFSAGARKSCVPGGLTLALGAASPHQGHLLEQLAHKATDEPAAYVCRGSACLRPARSESELLERLCDLGKAAKRS